MFNQTASEATSESNVNKESSAGFSRYVKAAAVLVTSTAAYCVGKTTGWLPWSWWGTETGETPKPDDTKALVSSATAVARTEVMSTQAALTQSNPLDIAPGKMAPFSATMALSEGGIGSPDGEEVHFEERYLSALAPSESNNQLMPRDVNIGRKLLAIGDEFRVNTYTTSEQTKPSVSALLGGGFIVTWESSGQDGDGLGVYGQRYDADGAVVGAEFRVNTHTANYQRDPSVASLANGGFVVMWQSDQDGNGLGVYGQRYDADGAVVGTEFRANTYTTSHQQNPSVAALANGSFVVVWMSLNQDGDAWGVYGQRYDTVGIAVDSEFRVNTYTADSQTSPSVAALTNGGFVVTWSSFGQDGFSGGIYGQRYDATGSIAGSEFRVNSFTQSSQNYTSIAGISNDGFVVTWSSFEQDGSDDGIYGQCYDVVGAAVRSEFRVNTHIQSAQGYPSVAALANGGFVVMWQSFGQDGDGYGIYGQRYDAAGTAVSNEFRVNSYTIGHQMSSHVAVLSNGVSVVVWTSDGQDGSSYGVYGKMFSAFTSLQSNVNSLSYTENSASILIDDQIVVTGSYNGLQSATIAVAANFNLDQDVLNFVNQNDIIGFYNATVGVLTLRGNSSVANYQTALRSVTYQNTSDKPSIAARSITVTVNDGSFPSNTLAHTLDIIAVNDVPVLVTNSLTINQGQTTTLTSNMLNTTDVDNNPSQLVYTVSQVQHGHFELVSNPGNPITNFTQQKINDGQIYFVHDGGQNAPSYLVSVSDGQASTTPTQATIMFRLAVSYAENDNAVIIDNTLMISDVNSAALQSATVAITNLQTGDELLFVNQLGITSSYNATTGVLTLTGSSSVANYQTALRSVAYRTTSDNPNTTPRIINIAVNDGSANVVVVTRAVNVIAVNDAPVLVTNTLSIGEGQTVTFTSTMLNATDVDNTPSQLTYSVSGVQHGRFELGSAPGNAITSFTQQQINDGQIRFLHDGGEIAPSYLVSVSDGQASTAPVAASVTFTPVNDAPVLSSSGATVSYIENSNAVVIDNSLVISDVDSAVLQSATVAITNLQTGDELLFINQLGITGSYNVVTGVLTLTGSSSVANYQIVLRTVSYRTISDNPNTISRIISVVVNDGSANSLSITKTVNVIAVNDAPLLTDAAGAVSYTGNREIVTVSSTLVLSDLDNDTLQGATIAITTKYKSNEDTLVFINQNGITGSFNVATGILTLSGTSSVANYQTALRSVAYQNSAESPDRSKRTVAYNVYDGASWGTAIQRDITYTTVGTTPTTSEASQTFWEQAQDRVVIGAPSVLGGLAITTFGIWAYRRQVDNSWKRHSQYALHNYLRKALKFSIGTVEEARGKGYLPVVFELLGQMLNCYRENKESDKAYYERLGEQVKSYSPEIIHSYGEALVQAIKTSTEFQIFCRVAQSEKPMVQRSRYLKDCCPNPTPFFVSYKFDADLFSERLINEIALKARDLLSQTRSDNIEMMSVNLPINSSSSAYFRERERGAVQQNTIGGRVNAFEEEGRIEGIHPQRTFGAVL